MRKLRKRTTLEEQLGIVNDYKSRVSLPDICNKYDISLGGIQGILKRNGVIRVNDILRRNNKRKYQYDEHLFSKIDTEHKAYWLGFLMADGCVSKNNITLCLKDGEMVYKFRDFIGNNKIPITDRKNCKGVMNQKVIYLGSQTMVNDLANYGLVPRKTFRTQIKNVPDALLKDFIRGYFDGDGCFYIGGRHSTVGITSSSNMILDQIQTILKNNNILRKDKTYIRYRSSKDKKSQWGILQIESKQEFIGFGNFIYNNATIFLQRKFDKFSIAKDRPFRIKDPNSSSKYFGVLKKTEELLKKQQTKKAFSCFLTVNKQKIKIGNFYTEIEAATAYNNKIKELGLPDYRLNKIEEPPNTK